MARARIASKVQKKLNFLCFGEPFTGKSTFALQFSMMHNEDGSPMRVLYIDCESGGADVYLDELEENGVCLENIYMVYTQSLGEVLDYIEKVKNREEFYMLDEEGEETDEVVRDANGNVFFPDAIIVDGVTVLHTAVQQGLVEFSKKRARVRADSNGLVGDEKLVAIEGSGLEIRDYGNIKFKAANLCLALLGTGVHSMITCRETDEKVSTKTANGQFTSVPTGKKIPDGFKDLDYNTHTVIRFYRDEFDNVCANVQKDRTGIHPKEVLTDPSLLDWQCVIDGNKGKKNFVLRNDLDTAVTTEQEIYSAEVMSNAAKSLSKSEMERAKAATNISASIEDIDEIKAKITAAIANLSQAEKSSVQSKLKEKNLPIQYKKLTDITVLTNILNTITE